MLENKETEVFRVQIASFLFRRLILLPHNQHLTECPHHALFITSALLSSPDHTSTAVRSTHGSCHRLAATCAKVQPQVLF